MLMEEAMAVSIPQSGLQAFRLGVSPPGTWGFGSFQSLNRAYKRSDSPQGPAPTIAMSVSIPQSGLQAFRHRILVDSILDFSGFQSLNRAYKRSDMTKKEAVDFINAVS